VWVRDRWWGWACFGGRVGWNSRIGYAYSLSRNLNGGYGWVNLGGGGVHGKRVSDRLLHLRFFDGLVFGESEDVSGSLFHSLLLFLIEAEAAAGPLEMAILAAVVDL
jgi:hypothetical protein